MAISLTYFPTREEHCTSNNVEDGTGKGTFLKKNKHKSKVDAPRSARGRPKFIIFTHIHEALEIYIKNTPFPPLAADAKARRTRKYAYLCTVSEGARSPPVAAAMKKEAPSATHGSLVVCEQDRTRKTTVRCCDLALESRTTSHVFSPPGPPFRPLASKNPIRVITSHRTPSDIARKRRPRAKSPQGPHFGHQGAPKGSMLEPIRSHNCYWRHFCDADKIVKQQIAAR